MHWSSLDDLDNLANDDREKAVDLFNYLYYGDDDFVDRLTRFKEETEIGTPGLGYLMSAYDYKKYAPIKVDDFRNFIDDFADNIPQKIGSYDIPEKYNFYCRFCDGMLDFLEDEEIIENGTPLDVQNFYFSKAWIWVKL